MAFTRNEGEEKWWITAMEMHASKKLERQGRERESQTKVWKEGSRERQMPIKLKLRSVPIVKMFSLFTGRYFPFPQPTSQTRDPYGSSSRNFCILGQGLYLVLLKWGAIFS